jgi:hypothetical protein
VLSTSVTPGTPLAREEHELVETAAGKDERPKLPFMKRAELLQPSFDAPVDIQRHVNPSYAARADDVSSSRDDVTTATNSQGIL